MFEINFSLMDFLFFIISVILTLCCNLLLHGNRYLNQKIKYHYLWTWIPGLNLIITLIYVHAELRYCKIKIEELDARLTRRYVSPVGVGNGFIPHRGDVFVVPEWYHDWRVEYRGKIFIVDRVLGNGNVIFYGKKADGWDYNESFAAHVTYFYYVVYLDASEFNCALKFNMIKN